MRHGLILLAAIVIALGSPALAPARADAVSCGDVVTEDVRLNEDLLDCPSGGLVIGANGITVDLNGHLIKGKQAPGGFGVGAGIDNSAGYDYVRIQNGSIREFAVGVRLEGARRNRLDGLKVSSEDGIVALSSDGNIIVDSSAYGFGPYMRVGEGIVLAQGSDGNHLLRTYIGGDGTPLWIGGSRGNVVSNSWAAGYSGIVVLAGAPRTTIRSSRISAGWHALGIYGSDRSLITGNQLLEMVDVVDSDRVRIVGNSIAALRVRSGDANEIFLNRVGFSHCDAIGIVVGAEATATRVERNSTNGIGWPEAVGIDVYAPGTLIRANLANDNGYLGIQGVRGVIDGGGNRARGNGDPRQCVNVDCASSNAPSLLNGAERAQ